MRRTILTLVLVVSLAGCGAIATDPASTEQSSNTTDAAASIDYSIDYKCQDHEAQSGEHIRKCSVDFWVNDPLPEGVEYVQLHVSDAIDSETESYLITDVESPKYAYPTDLLYGDTVVVEAQLSDGDRVVLENHTLSCEDVSYRDACESHGDSQNGGDADA